MAKPEKEESFIITNKEYILTQKQLKAYLEIEGDITSMGLYEGLSPIEEEQGKSKDLQKFYINVVEKKQIKKKEVTDGNSKHECLGILATFL